MEKERRAVVRTQSGFSLLVAEYLEQALAIDDQSQIAELIQPSTMDCSEKRRNLRELLRWNGGVGSLSRELLRSPCDLVRFVCDSSCYSAEPIFAASLQWSYMHLEIAIKVIKILSYRN